MYCINCGHELQENANFCAFCGRKSVAFPVKTDKIEKNKDGWEYLKENEIEGAACDLEHNFAFVSYAHTKHDAAIVNEVFKQLTDRGYNLWIDTANMPYDANHWKMAADKAMHYPKNTCQMVLFFRSEDSITRGTIYKELHTFAEVKDKDDIVTVGIYKDPDLHTRTYRAALQKMADEADAATEEGAKAKEKSENMNKICGIVSESCKAIQLPDVDNDISKLCDVIEERLAEHDILQRFGLADKIAYIMDGSFRIKPQGDQRAAFMLFEKMLEKSIGPNGDGKKRTLIIEGDPGTGKSVLLMYMLSWLRAHQEYRNREIRWVSKNNAPRQVYEENLKKDLKKMPDREVRKEIREKFKEIFCGQKSIITEQKNKSKKMVSDVLFIDEAHRLTNFDRYTPNVDMAEEMFSAGICTVAMVDDNQVVTTADCGSREEIYHWAEKSGAEIYTAKMQSQLRCKGSDSYLKWLDGILEINPMDKYVAKTTDYEIKVFDDPKDMYAAIKEKNTTEGISRMLAGYCWEWLSKGRDDNNVHDIQIGDFGMSWNFQSGKPYAADENSIEQVGCVHTTQGLEFYYAGVIVGPDMRYEDGRIVTDFTKRAKTDASTLGLVGMMKKDPERAQKKAEQIVKNTYRVLMSRGVKGCYIYCVDPSLNEYMHKVVERYNESKIDL